VVNPSRLALPFLIDFLSSLVFGTESLYLFENQLSGPLPSQIGILSNLKQLVASGNQINGSIPEQIGSLTTLLDLRLSNNSITGSIPQSMSGLTSIMRLQLHGNNLTGTAPIGLCLLTTPTYKLHDFTADCSLKNMEINCTCCTSCYHD
jgi:Leucine-rich repeat (LRR) protein